MNKEALMRETTVKTFVLSKLTDRMSDSKLKAILGGYDPGTCCGKPPAGVCACGMSRESAWQYAKCENEGNNCLGNWCCESCGSATWVPGCVSHL